MLVGVLFFHVPGLHFLVSVSSSLLFEQPDDFWAEQVEFDFELLGALSEVGYNGSILLKLLREDDSVFCCETFAQSQKYLFFVLVWQKLVQLFIRKLTIFAELFLG